MWTTGFQAPELAREAGLATDEGGRMLVDATLRSISHPEVYAVGDAAAGVSVGGAPSRMTGRAAAAFKEAVVRSTVRSAPRGDLSA